MISNYEKLKRKIIVLCHMWDSVSHLIRHSNLCIPNYENNIFWLWDVGICETPVYKVSKLYNLLLFFLIIFFVFFDFPGKLESVDHNVIGNYCILSLNNTKGFVKIIIYGSHWLNWNTTKMYQIIFIQCFIFIKIN